MAKEMDGLLKPWALEMKILFENHILGKRKLPTSARDDIVRRFEKWLDEVLAAPKPLEGFDRALLSELEGETGNNEKASIADHDDIYATWGAVTALTQEVKLQGRAFKELSNGLSPLRELGTSMEHLAAAHGDAVSDAKGMAERAHAALTDYKKDLKLDADLRSRNEVIDALLDARERLIMGLKSTEESWRTLESGATGNWFGKWRNGTKSGIKHAMDIIASLKKGYGLGLDRLDETLLKWGVVEIECEGKPFDPNVMTAVDMEEKNDVPDGTVIDVFRTGYAVDTEILRPPQVKVARAPMDSKERI
jgi:hypothetical protein